MDKKSSPKPKKKSIKEYLEAFISSVVNEKENQHGHSWEWQRRNNNYN